MTDKWQPIDTAPADTELLLGWFHQFLGDGRCWHMTVDFACSTRGGWWHGQATHWMPLPEPPEETSHE